MNKWNNERNPNSSPQRSIYFQVKEHVPYIIEALTLIPNAHYVPGFMLGTVIETEIK